MANFHLSKLADLDMEAIADYTLDTWGVDQTLRYLDSFEHCFMRIAETPKIGRRCDRIRPGYRRFEHKKHVIFYTQESGGIIIGRVLHWTMLPTEHSIEDE